MNDKELADRVVSLHVACRSPSDFYYLVDQSSRSNIAEYFVRDWRVAGALMEKCKADMRGPVTIYVSTPASQDFHVRAFDGLRGHEAESDSLPRAIIEACCEALAAKEDTK